MSYKRSTKRRKLSWYGNPNVRHIGGHLYFGLLGKPNAKKSDAKTSARRWRGTGRRAQVKKAKGGWRVYVTRARFTD